MGKSTLLNRLTNAKSKVAAYQFTTLTVVPGIMDYRGARIQILDLPGIIEGASSGKGLGKRVLSVARNADLIIFLLDVFQPEATKILKKELRNIGIRADERPPNVVIEKTSSGGITVSIQVKLTKISEELVKDILRVYDINSARAVIREDITDDQLVDVLLGNRVYIPSLTVMNKVDLVNAGFLNEVSTKVLDKFVPVSAESNVNLNALKEEIYKRLDFIRIYMKPRGAEADMKEPLIVRNGSNVLDICNKLTSQDEGGFAICPDLGKKRQVCWAEGRGDSQIDGRRCSYFGNKVKIWIIIALFGTTIETIRNDEGWTSEMMLHSKTDE